MAPQAADVAPSVIRTVAAAQGKLHGQSKLF